MRKLKNVMAVLLMFMVISLFFGLLTNSASAQDLNFEIRETITIPTEHSGAIVLYVGDLDYDGNLDIDYAFGDGASDPYDTYIIERDGNTFVNRFTFEGYGTTVAEVDGDNYPEIFAPIGERSAKILEATGDNAYAEKYSMSFSGKIEQYWKAGDSDGDGKREFLIPAEWDGVRIYEADSNDTYVLEETLIGSCPDGSSYGCGNGNIRSVGVYDLDGDGHPETVFTANPYQNEQNTLYVFTESNGTREQIYYSNVGPFASQSLGDLNGNGQGEIIGSTYPNKELIIYESQGTNDNFQIVYQGPASPEYPYRSYDVMDFDEDGQSELWRPIVDSNPGQLDVFTLAHLSGGTIIDFYNSSELLQGLGDIKRLLAIGDTNGDGGLELAVVQGDQIHILEQETVSIQCDGEQADIVGTEGHDIIYGTDEAEVIHGLGGNDIIFGLGGDDRICGGDGEDIIYGGKGSDRLFGNSGKDVLLGNGGKDKLFGGTGNDSLGGGSGNDKLKGGTGNDTLQGGNGNDELIGGANTDVCDGSGGNTEDTADDTCEAIVNVIPE